MTNDVFGEPERIYIVLVQFQLWILIPKFFQCSRGILGKYSSRVCMSVQLVEGCYGLSVRGFMSCFVFLVLKMILIPSQVGI